GVAPGPTGLRPKRRPETAGRETLRGPVGPRTAGYLGRGNGSVKQSPGTARVARMSLMGTGKASTHYAICGGRAAARGVVPHVAARQLPCAPTGIGGAPLMRATHPLPRLLIHIDFDRALEQRAPGREPSLNPGIADDALAIELHLLRGFVF